jgi:hypothetical protein
MSVRLNITMDEALYRRLKRDLPPKRISAFINEAVRARLRPGREALDRAYRLAAIERDRQAVADEWSATETEDWPA